MTLIHPFRLFVDFCTAVERDPGRHGSGERIADRQQRIDNLRAQSFVLQETHASLQDVRRFTKEQERLWARVRTHGELARIEVPEREQEKLFSLRFDLHDALRALGFAYVTMDLKGFRSGSMNETLK